MRGLTKNFQCQLNVIEVHVSSTGNHTFVLKGTVLPKGPRGLAGSAVFNGVLPRDIGEPFVEAMVKRYMEGVAQTDGEEDGDGGADPDGDAPQAPRRRGRPRLSSGKPQ